MPHAGPVSNSGPADKPNIMKKSIDDFSTPSESSKPPREGWAEAFEAMAKLNEDELLDGPDLPPTSWDLEEWEW